MINHFCLSYAGHPPINAHKLKLNRFLKIITTWLGWRGDTSPFLKILLELPRCLCDFHCYCVVTIHFAVNLDFQEVV